MPSSASTSAKREFRLGPPTIGQSSWRKPLSPTVIAFPPGIAFLSTSSVRSPRLARIAALAGDLYQVRGLGQGTAGLLRLEAQRDALVEIAEDVELRMLREMGASR